LLILFFTFCSLNPAFEPSEDLEAHEDATVNGLSPEQVESEIDQKMTNVEIMLVLWGQCHFKTQEEKDSFDKLNNDFSEIKNLLIDFKQNRYKIKQRFSEKVLCSCLNEAFRNLSEIESAVSKVLRIFTAT